MVVVICSPATSVRVLAHNKSRQHTKTIAARREAAHNMNEQQKMPFQTCAGADRHQHYEQETHKNTQTMMSQVIHAICTRRSIWNTFTYHLTKWQFHPLKSFAVKSFCSEKSYRWPRSSRVYCVCRLCGKFLRHDSENLKDLP